MLTLSLLNAANIPFALDLYSNEPFVFSLQYNDVQNIQTPTGSYSQTFTLPFDHLTSLIGQIFEPGYVPLGSENGQGRTLFFKK